MRKAIASLTLALTLIVSSLGFSASAFADPPLPEGCTKDRGTVYCTEIVYLGESENTKVYKESQKGSFSSSHDPDCGYTNPGGNLPGGQQGC